MFTMEFDHYEIVPQPVQKELEKNFRPDADDS